MSGIKIANGTAASGELTVDTDGNAHVTLPTDFAQAGGALIVSENDPGGTVRAPYVLSPETEEDYRLRVVNDTVIDAETFNYANQNTGKHTYTSTTLTFDLSGGFLRSNASGITTINTAARFFSQRMFQAQGGQTALYCEVAAGIDAAMATNTTIDFGMVLLGSGSPYAPTDGAYIRAASTGWLLVINNGGEITASLVDGNNNAFSPAIGQIYKFVITVTNEAVRAWIDDVLYATIPCQAGLGAPHLATSLQFGVRHAIGGTVASGVVRLRIANYSVQGSQLGYGVTQSVQMAAMGQGMQVQQGASTGGQLTTYALGAAPGAVTLTASTAPATNTLGGLALLPSTITAAEADYPLFAWLNPAGTAAIPGRTFICTGIIVGDAVIYPTALTGGPLIIQWALGWGSTASSLATTESTTFSSATTKIARKIPLGTQVFAAAAAAGTLAAGFQRSFVGSEIAVNPGEYLHVIIRCQGTNTSGGTPRVQCAPLGYFV